MELLDALLTGGIPSSILGNPLPRVRNGAYPTDLDVDADGYPDDDRIDEVAMVAMMDARRWLHDELPHLWDSIRRGRVSTRETFGGKEIHVYTGGWSGCESLINAVLKHIMMARYCKEQTRGGGYTFVVPHED